MDITVEITRITERHPGSTVDLTITCGDKEWDFIMGKWDKVTITPEGEVKQVFRGESNGTYRQR